MFSFRSHPRLQLVLARLKKERDGHRPWVLRSTFILVVFIILGIVIGWEFRTKTFHGNFSANPITPGGRVLSLSLDVVSVDPIARVVTLDWSILDDSCITSSYNTGDPLPSDSDCPLVNIYVDPNLLAPTQGNGNQPAQIGSSALASSDLSSMPIFQYNVSSLLLYASSFPIFRTSLVMYSTSGAIAGTSTKRTLERSPENYPFDTYASDVFMFGQTNDTSEFVALSIDEPTGIAFGFYVRGERFPDASAPPDPNAPPDFNDFVNLELSIKRAGLVKTYVIVVILAMWSISLGLVVISLKAVVFGHATDSAVLVVPAATLFAFTGLRSTLPGAPAGFDFVGTLPAIGFLLLAVLPCLHELGRELMYPL
ncbi:hypothetical protein FA95DRAFT_1597486 [Auriscalpium vulgare]|uniref:Uncharacterized protein n=1 Tax=Auriscalpium vulgare TaxID=40419 RepID=A0ACB8RL07_9AGAM|nr:hypothetical protein FA95DRAFT_1597486 [Auriscalpium vulgare]